MNVVKAIPLFTYLWLAYNLLLLTGNMPALLDHQLAALTLISGAQWTLKVSELFLALGVVFLYVEIFKATRTGSASVIDHTVSMLVFVAFLIELITVKGAGNSTFAILALMSMLDVVAGFTVSIIAARRDFSVGNPHSGD